LLDAGQTSLAVALARLVDGEVGLQRLEVLLRARQPRLGFADAVLGGLDVLLQRRALSLGRVQRGGLVGQVRLQDCESTRNVGQVAVGGLAGRAGSLRRLFGEALEQAMMAEQLGFSARPLLGSTGLSLTEHRQAALGHPYLLKERFGALPQL